MSALANSKRFKIFLYDRYNKNTGQINEAPPFRDGRYDVIQGHKFRITERMGYRVRSYPLRSRCLVYDLTCYFFGSVGLDFNNSNERDVILKHIENPFLEFDLVGYRVSEIRRFIKITHILFANASMETTENFTLRDNPHPRDVSISYSKSEKSEED